jgi:hypothetical protein
MMVWLGVGPSREFFCLPACFTSGVRVPVIVLRFLFSNYPIVLRKQDGEIMQEISAR